MISTDTDKPTCFTLRTRLRWAAMTHVLREKGYSWKHIARLAGRTHTNMIYHHSRLGEFDALAERAKTVLK